MKQYSNQHWTHQYVRILVLFLLEHYPNRSALQVDTGLSLAIISRISNGEGYSVSLNTMARLEEAAAKVIKDIDNAKKINKHGASKGGNGKAIDDFPKPPYGVLREG